MLMSSKWLSLAAFVVAFVVVSFGARPVGAVPVTFTDVYDPADKLMNKKNKVYTFTHDINDDGFNSSTDTLTSGLITVDVRDDSLHDDSERVNFNIDGQNLGTYEVDFSDFSFLVNVTLLQTDGMLQVKLTRKEGDFYFRSSTLTVHGNRYVPDPIPDPIPVIIPPIGGGGTPGTVAVPEPGALFLLGLGGASAGLLGLLRKKKA